MGKKKWFYCRHCNMWLFDDEQTCNDRCIYCGRKYEKSTEENQLFPNEVAKEIIEKEIRHDRVD